jgi:hypothetical protein
MAYSSQRKRERGLGSISEENVTREESGSARSLKIRSLAEALPAKVQGDEREIDDAPGGAET